MYSFLICDLKNQLKKSEIVKKIYNQFENPEICFLCTDNKIKKSNKYKSIIFDKKVSDDIALNSTFKILKYNKIFVIRSGFDNFDNLYLLKENQNYDISMFKPKRKLNFSFIEKVKDFLSNLYYKIFDYKFFKGDISCIFFNENTSMVLKEFDNAGTFTKINKWIGMKINYIEYPIKKYVPQISFKEKWLNFSIWCLLFITSLVVSILLNNLLLYELKILLYSICGLSFTMFLFYIVRVYSFTRIGKIENQIYNNFKIKE